MADRFTDYHAAAAVARERADRTRLDVAIRRTKEYGRDGYNVSFASHNDSDYTLAEIVTPEPVNVTFGAKLYSEFNVAAAHAQALSDSNEAPVGIWERDDWYTVCETAPDEIEPDPELSGWSLHAVVDPYEKPVNPRERGDDDGVEYGDPRDAEIE